ncbi:hypothetical protein BH10PSE13_BH10PSE13_05280 [soil metagenome]
MVGKAGKTAGEVGIEIRDAFAVSTSTGWNVLGSHMNRDGVEGYHIPQLDVDGLLFVDCEALAVEGQAFDKAGIKVTVDVVRPLSDDTVILETTWSGTLPSGDFSFPMPFVFTVMAGKVVRAIEFCDFDTPVGRELWIALGAAGYHGGSSVNLDTGATSPGSE